MIGTEVFGNGYTIKVLAYFAVMYWRYVKKQKQTNEKCQCCNETGQNQDNLAFSFVVCAANDYEWLECVGEKEASDKSEQVGVVVNPGQQTAQKQHGSEPDELEQRHLWITKDRPLMDDLDHATSQQAKVSARWTNLSKCKLLYLLHRRQLSKK